MSLLSSKNRYEHSAEVKPYLDQIHARSEVRGLYLICEGIKFARWLISMLTVLILILPITTSIDVPDLSYIYIYFTNTWEGITGVAILVVVYLVARIALRIMHERLYKLELDAYYKIIEDQVYDIKPESRITVGKIIKALQTLISLGVVLALLIPYIGLF